MSTSSTRAPDRLAADKTLTSIAWCALVVGAAVLLLQVVRLAPSPLRFDEAEFGEQARAVFVYDGPRIPESADRRIGTPFLAGYPGFRYGMWHPPIYVYSLAAAGELLSFQPLVLRLVGVVWCLAAVVFLWFLQSVPSGIPPSARLLTLSLMCLSPLLVEGSMFIDIDNTALNAMLVCFAWRFLAAPDDRRPAKLVELGGILALACGCKLTTPVLMPAAVALYGFARGRYLQSIVQSVSITALAIIFFALGYFLYCFLLDYPSGFMFDFSFVGKRGRYTNPRGFVEYLQSLRWNLVWISLPLAIAFLVTTVDRVWRWFVTRTAGPVDFLVIFAVLNVLAYVVWGGTLGKYMYPGAFFGVAAVGWRLNDVLSQARFTKHTWAVAGAALALCLFHVLAVAPYLVKPPMWSANQGFMTQVLWNDPRNLAALASIAAYGVFVATVWRLLPTQEPLDRVLLTAIVFAFAANPVGIVKTHIQPYDFSPLHPLQERGFVDAVAMLNQRCMPEDAVLCPKDIGTRISCRYYESSGGIETLERLESGEAKYLLDNEAFPALDPALWRGENAPLEIVERHGDHVLLVLRKR